MRMVGVIVVLGAIAVGLVQLRRREVVFRHDIQCLRLERMVLRRKLWDQQVRLGYLTAPNEIRRRVETASLNRSGGSERLVSTMDGDRVHRRE